MDRQLASLDRALELDPDFAQAHALKAFLYSQAPTSTAFGDMTDLSIEEIIATIREHAGRALALDPMVPTADVALGNLYLFTWRWEQARRAYERIGGREQVKAFLQRKWRRELDYRLRKFYWAHTANRIAVRFEYEWHDASGRWYRSYGNENWEFDDGGPMSKRYASINDVPIEESDRRIL